MISTEIFPALSIACVSGLVAVVLRDVDRRLGTLESKTDRLTTSVSELTGEVRMLKERISSGSNPAK